MLKTIETIVAEKIRPVLQEHGGDLEVLSYKDGVVRVRLLGQCAGCPSAMLTNEEVIKSNLMEALPEIQDVLVVQETSPELIAFAKELMGRHRA